MSNLECQFSYKVKLTKWCIESQIGRYIRRYTEQLASYGNNEDIGYNNLNYTLTHYHNVIINCFQPIKLDQILQES